MPMDTAQVLAAYDAQVRRGQPADGSGVVVWSDSNLMRWASPDVDGWSGITWSDLSSVSSDHIDEVIAAQIGYFSERGQRFEWKLYDYDRPEDLAQRLRAARFVADDDEALMVSEASALDLDPSLPEGVQLIDVDDETGIGLLIDVHEQVFGTDHSALHRDLLRQLHESPETTSMVVAMAGDRPVCSARIEFPSDGEFAGLWGGGTLPEWRGRGIYRALVAYRAQLAVARGYRYLQVDASSESRPILKRLGFVVLASTTPYIWQPG